MDRGIRTNTDEFYVAPGEAPPSRRPPITETGIIHWLRTNLFSSTTDTIITIVTLTALFFFLVEFLDWAIINAQWEIVALNMRVLSTGQQFPPSEGWRIELVAMLIIGLSMLSVAVWGRAGRVVWGTLGVIALIMVGVPFLSQFVSEPPVYYYGGYFYNAASLTPTYELYTPRETNFIAESGQEITFVIDPLTQLDDYQPENLETGFYENDNQLADTAFDVYNSTSRQVRTEMEAEAGQNAEVPFDVHMALQILDAEGAVIAQSDFTDGSPQSVVLEWEAPASDWYTFRLVYDEDNVGTVGGAFLRIENLEVFRSTLSAQANRTEEYGPEPELDCRGCATSANRTDMRFEGQRTVPQWFSLQLSPFLLETRGFFFKALLVSIVAYFLGRGLQRTNLRFDETFDAMERLMMVIGFVMIVLFVGVQLANTANPTDALNAVSLVIVMSFIALLVVYALEQFVRDDQRGPSRAVTVLWITAIPVIYILLIGFSSDAASAAADSPLPRIDVTNIGGLLLTLLLSAVAILLSFPFGILLALGRQSTLPVVSLLSTILIEFFRGVPLITLLFVGWFIFPLLGFGLGNVDLLIRIGVVLTLFTSAYMAEVVRGGLQIVPKGQLEAAHALGLNGFWTTTLIVLPQALRAVIPAMMGQAVSLFKDTSLLYIVGLFDVVGTMNELLGDNQTGYTRFPREAFLFLGLVFFVFCYIMATVSRRIERTGAGSVRRETM